MKGRSIIFQLHLWLGLSIGLYLAVMGLTGSLLMFAEPIDRWLNPALHQPIEAGHPQPFERALSGFRRQYPEATISRIRCPNGADGPISFWIHGWSAKLKQVYVDPTSGEIVGQRWLLGSVVGFARYLHFNLIAGQWGWLINGYLALAGTLVLLTGAWLWLPRTWRQLKQRLWVKWRSTPTRINWDLHNALGAWTLLPLLILTLTGASFAFHGTVKSIVGAFFQFSEPEPRAGFEPASGPTTRPSLDELVRAADAAIVDSRVFEVRWRRQGHEPLTAYLWPENGKAWNQWARVTVDSRSGAVRSVKRQRTTGDRVMSGIFAVHAGTFGGLLVKSAYCVMGMLPAVLLTTGLIMYLKRQARRRRVRRV